jgi:hypothetical protein
MLRRSLAGNDSEDFGRRVLFDIMQCLTPYRVDTKHLRDWWERENRDSKNAVREHSLVRHQTAGHKKSKKHRVEALKSIHEIFYGLSLP